MIPTHDSLAPVHRPPLDIFATGSRDPNDPPSIPSDSPDLDGTLSFSLSSPPVQKDRLQRIYGAIDRLSNLVPLLIKEHALVQEPECAIDDQELAFNSDSDGSPNRIGTGLSTSLGSPEDAAESSHDNNSKSSSSWTTAPNSQPSFASDKRKRLIENNEGEDESEERGGKRPKESPGSVNFDERPIIQIPCFVDNCPGKDAHISELM